ncbi:baseplate assembly protein [Sphingomonas jatrophae]|uniref:Phage-related baseplate assembly protein n=1 Tax=Sphingomonas jatrophae TaxID=1166337 RepID=A0A1I6JLH3_9SPHN|nr:baseplate J/gp47 family protein [Sphingomonas jatrophae]SFR79789.1 Phage-related baseplate assembly protein [Sphingomonas jatrophae]
MSAASTFIAVDLSRLPAPTIVEQLSFEQILTAMRQQLHELLPEFDAFLESDPAIKILEVVAYRELLIRADCNDAGRGNMLAFATGANLDNLGALFGVSRLLIAEGDAQQGIDPTYESDTALRRRITLAPEGYSVAGPEGAYLFHALSADPDVLDATATSPAPGEVLVTVLSRTGSGAADAELVAAVDAYLSADTRRPLTDAVTVQSAEIVTYSVDAAITVFDGPDAAIVLAEAQAQLEDYCARSHRLGYDVTRSGIFAALHVEGVQNVALTAPAADIVVSGEQAAWRTALTLTIVGTGE